MAKKEVIWIGSSLDDLCKMPDQVKKAVGYSLDGIQSGEYDSNIKPLTGKDLGGVYEIRADFDSDTYRAAYVVNIGTIIYMLHVFKKKSKKGKETPKPDMDKIRSRLKQAKELAKKESENE